MMKRIPFRMLHKILRTNEAFGILDGIAGELA